MTIYSKLDQTVSDQCIAIFDAISDTYIGTGTLIDNLGMFISVAHNFNNVGYAYKAYYNNKVYEIRTLVMEYDPERCKDMFIGELIDFTEYDIKLLPLAEQPVDYDSEIMICGFKSRRIAQNPFKECIEITDKLEIQQYITKARVIDKEQWLKLLNGKISPRENDDVCQYIDINTSMYKGLSGGPLYSNNGIHGILIGDVYLPVEYIKRHIPK